MVDFWNDFLYRPVFNLLIWIYNNLTNQNLGWAVIYLTILLRIALLPFTLVTEKARADNLELEKEVERVTKEFHHDRVQQKEQIRKILRKRRVRPWAKTISLGVQVLVFILLYQVFISGITGRNLFQFLYPSVDFPGKINTLFYGFQLGEVHTFFWPSVVALVLFLEIYLEYRKYKGRLQKTHLAYIIVFPIFSLAALWFLPMVKSLFVLTSSLFSDIIHQFSMRIFGGGKSRGNHH